MACQAGDFLYIPAGVPHLPFNPSETEICTAVLSRTDSNEQESVKLLPELDELHMAIDIKKNIWTVAAVSIPRRRNRGMETAATISKTLSEHL